MTAPSSHSRARLGTRPRSRARVKPGTTPSSAPSHRSPRSSRSRPRESRANEITVPSGDSRRGVLKSPQKTRGPEPAARPARSAASVSGLIQPLAAFGTCATWTVTPSTTAASVVSGQGTASDEAAPSGARAAIDTPVRRRLIGSRFGSAPSSEQTACGRPMVAKRRPPQRPRAGGHLLQRDHVRLPRRPAPPPAARAPTRGG